MITLLKEYNSVGYKFIVPLNQNGDSSLLVEYWSDLVRELDLTVVGLYYR